MVPFSPLTCFSCCIHLSYFIHLFFLPTIAWIFVVCLFILVNLFFFLEVGGGERERTWKFTSEMRKLISFSSSHLLPPVELFWKPKKDLSLPRFLPSLSPHRRQNFVPPFVLSRRFFPQSGYYLPFIQILVLFLHTQIFLHIMGTTEFWYFEVS